MSMLKIGVTHWLETPLCQFCATCVVYFLNWTAYTILPLVYQKYWTTFRRLTLCQLKKKGEETYFIIVAHKILMPLSV